MSVGDWVRGFLGRGGKPALEATGIYRADGKPRALGPLLPTERRSWLLAEVVDPVLADLQTRGVKSDDRARVLLLAIAGQESGIQHRRQVPVAHARGLWQFERGGGVAGVLSHKATGKIAAAVAEAAGVRAETTAVYEALEHNDRLAAACARLLLWSDPKALPFGAQGGWETYLRTWRPGKPHLDRWADNWRLAVDAVRAKPQRVE